MTTRTILECKCDVCGIEKTYNSVADVMTAGWRIVSIQVPGAIGTIETKDVCTDCLHPIRAALTKK